jgi:hypothetical protein
LHLSISITIAPFIFAMIFFHYKKNKFKNLFLVSSNF